MRIERPRQEGELINLTPLIDVVFNLLIFFMVTGSLAAADALEIDPASSTSKMRGDVDDVVFLVDDSGRIALGERIVTKADLPGVVRETLTANPEALIQLKPDTGADAAGVIDIMERIREGGAEYIVLVTVQRSGGGK
jgi:biopolymer transport protein ExbD